MEGLQRFQQVPVESDSFGSFRATSCTPSPGGATAPGLPRNAPPEAARSSPTLPKTDSGGCLPL
eukprot:13707777-Alexandrium_andersonii.AAC.1